MFGRTADTVFSQACRPAMLSPSRAEDVDNDSTAPRGPASSDWRFTGGAVTPLLEVGVQIRQVGSQLGAVMFVLV